MAFSKNRRLAQIISDINGNISVQGITVPTQSASDNDTSAASTAFVHAHVNALVDSAPGTLNTLNELAAALNDQDNFGSTITAAVNAKLPLAGGTLTGNLNFGDSDKAIFGAGSDLQIYHDGSHSIITDQGTGSLLLRGTAGVFIQNAEGTENIIAASADGAVTLYHDNSSKLATTSTGIDVTGVITSKGVASLNDAQIGRINFTNTNSNASSNPIRASILSGRQNSAWGGYLSLYTSTGTDAASEKVRIGETGNVGIGETNPDASLHITSNTPIISFDESDAGQEFRIGSFGGAFAVYDSTDSAYRLVVDGSGNLLVGTTSTTVGGATSGFGFRVDGASGIVQAAASGNTSAIFNRTSSDGAIVS